MPKRGKVNTTTDNIDFITTQQEALGEGNDVAAWTLTEGATVSKEPAVKNHEVAVIVFMYQKGFLEHSKIGL